MDQPTACIFNIQRYSIHDGPGIRTVVFFKGCPLKCPWCSNPESQSIQLQLAHDESNCSHCLTCLKNCPQQAIALINNKITFHRDKCIRCFHCVATCPQQTITLQGKHLSLDDVMKAVMKDKVFYEESKGGVTLSGGEALLQHKFAIALLQQLKEQEIHTACETTGYAAPNIFKTFIRDIDLLLFDIKHYDSLQHYHATGVYNEIIITNLKMAISQEKTVIIRIPVIPTINDSLEAARGFCKLLKEAGATKVNLLPFHQFGQKKHSLLNKEYRFAAVAQLHEEDLQAYQEIFIQNGLDCTI
jgi:pyruvate formate lyase activating enzyme